MVNNPNIRFAGFADEWVQCKLGDVLNKNGKKNKDLIIKRVESVSNKTGFTNQKDQFDDYSVASADLSNYYVIQEKQFAYNPSRINVGSIAYKEIGDQLSVVSPLYVSFSTEGSLDDKFLWNWFKTVSFGHQRRMLSEGGVRDTLSFNKLAEMDILVSELKEQQKIGSIFSTLDHKIGLEERQIALLKDLKKGYLQKLFPKNGAKVPELRFAGFADDWEDRKLGRIGKTFTGLSGKTKEDFGHGDAKFVTYVNVFENLISNPNKTERVEIDEKQNQIKYGDVFFTTSSETPEEVGMSSVWLDNTENIYLNSFCFGYRPTTELDSYYLAFMLRSPSIRKKFIFLAQGISRYNISKTKVMELEVPVPEIDEQQKIGSFFKQLDDTIARHQHKLELLKDLKKGLLQQLFV